MSTIGGKTIQGEPALLNIKQLEYYVGLDSRTIERLVSAGKFPAPVALPVRCRRWSRRQLDAWIEGLTKPMDAAILS